jgi:hypothetical protein
MGMREYVKAISPPFLIGDGDPTQSGPSAVGYGERFRYSMAVVVDMVIEKITEGVKARMPGVGDVSALPYIGADRAITRGMAESDAGYAERLTHAFDTWKFAGTARGVMVAVTSWLVGATPKVWSVLQGPSGGASSWDVYAAGADTTQPPTHTAVLPSNWNWDGMNRPKRRWLIIDGTGWFSSTHKWGDAGLKWGAPGLAWGCDATGYGDTIRQMLAQWRSAGCNWLWAIITTDPTYFPEAGAAGDPKLPDGNFGCWSKIVGGVRVPSRFSVARYINGVDGV